MRRHDYRKHTVSRRALLQVGAAITFGSTMLAGLGATAPTQAAGKKVIIGAFADGGLTPFKEKIIPLAKAAGFDIEYLEDEYGVTGEVVRRCQEWRRPV